MGRTTYRIELINEDLQYYECSADHTESNANEAVFEFCLSFAQLRRPFVDNINDPEEEDDEGNFPNITPRSHRVTRPNNLNVTAHKPRLSSSSVPLMDRLTKIGGIKSVPRILFLNTKYDSKLDQKTETTQIGQTAAEYTQKNLTFKDFGNALNARRPMTGSKIDIIDEKRKESEQALTELPPHILHMSTHGNHNYWEVDEQKAFSISFEETHTVLQLLDDDPEFSAFYALIAVLFEMEISKFVLFGLKHHWIERSDPKHRHHRPRDRMKTTIRSGIQRDQLLQNRTIYALLHSICLRFGCHCLSWDQFTNSNYSDGQTVQIWWGRNANGKWQSPCIPLDGYGFERMYIEDGDQEVKSLLDETRWRYKQSLEINHELRQYIEERPWRCFAWEIMFVLLNRKLFENGAIPNEFDDTKWKEPEPEPTDHNEDGDDMKDLNDDEDDSWGSWLDGSSGDEDEEMKDGDDTNDDTQSNEPRTSLLNLTSNPDGLPSEEGADSASGTESVSGNDFEHAQQRTTETKLRNIQNLTRELKIVPKQSDSNRDLIGDKLKKLSTKLSKMREGMVRTLKKLPDVQLRSDYPSETSFNVHILRFANMASIDAARQQIREIADHPKFWSFDILFRPISEADTNTKRQVGYIKETQAKHFYLDIHGQQKDNDKKVVFRDPISIKLREKLISRKQCTIKLAILNSCYSYALGRKMAEFVENVVCVHPYVQILDSAGCAFATAFYAALKQNSNSKTPISQSALVAFQKARECIKEKCKRDRKCRVHSHCNPSGDCRHQQRYQERYKTLHFGGLHGENWNEIQRIMDCSDNDWAAFKAYRSKMEESGAIPKDERDFNLYDGCTLKLCNISMSKMIELQRYLCLALNLEEMKEHHISRQNDFVGHSLYCQDPNFEELSVGYFKFRSKAHRNLARKKLNIKKKEESIGFSDRVHKKEHWTEKGKEYDFAWYHRDVPRCCCSPQYPHLAQDKWILIHRGRIVNRRFIDSLDDLQRESILMKERKALRMEKHSLPSQSGSDVQSSTQSLSSTNALTLQVPMQNEQSSNTLNVPHSPVYSRPKEDKSPPPWRQKKRSDARKKTRNDFGSGKQPKKKTKSENESEFGRRRNHHRNRNSANEQDLGISTKNSVKKRNRW